MKSSRMHDNILPSVEDEQEDELLRYRSVVEIPDTEMQEAQVDPLREPIGGILTPSRDSRSTTIGIDIPPPQAIKTPKKQQTTGLPTASDLAAMARNTSPNVIAQAMLNQEVRGLRQMDLLATPAVAAAINKALEEARKPVVRFQEPDPVSGETMVVERQDVHDMPRPKDLRQMYEWGSQGSSGETYLIGADSGEGEVITREVLKRLCPNLSRGQEVLQKRAEEANEVQDYQNYDVEEDEDGYNEEQSKVPTGARLRLEDQHRRYSVKGQLPTCWVSLHGGMGRALIDTGSQLNVMRLSTARALNVYITKLN